AMAFGRKPREVVVSLSAETLARLDSLTLDAQILTELLGDFAKALTDLREEIQKVAFTDEAVATAVANLEIVQEPPPVPSTAALGFAPQPSEAAREAVFAYLDVEN